MATRHKASRHGRLRREFIDDSEVMRSAKSTVARGGRPKARHGDLKGTGHKCPAAAPIAYHGPAHAAEKAGLRRPRSRTIPEGW